MAKRLTWRSAIIGIAVLALAITAAALLSGRGSYPASSATDVPARDSSSEGPSGAPDGAGAQSGAAAPLDVTVYDGELIPPKTSTRLGPAASDSGVPAGPTPDERYRADTRAVVEVNAAALAEMTRLIAEALGSGDEEFFAGLVPDGEPGVASYVGALADSYPPIDTYAPGTNVNVFSTGETTLYYAYALVTWTDGGITSQHTVPIVLRFVDGEWRLSALGETSPNLAFVQSVDL